MAKAKLWVVTTSGDKPLKEVKKQLTALGFEVEEVLDEIGSLTGRTNDAVAKRSRAIPGVADVSPVGQVDIGPPDAPVTW